jgi:L-seryl-tRNA(Ser) seleniumtransferase
VLKPAAVCVSLHDMAHDPLRELPAVSRLLAHPRTERLLGRFNREYVVQGCRAILDELRTAISDGHSIDPTALEAESIVARLESRIGAARGAGLQRVVNATGTVLHTNLGRALLPEAAVAAVLQAAAHPIDLEYDLARGERGKREDTIEQLLVELTGAEAATVVNNNAAAVLLALNTLANGKEVIVSRGELIEIGGAFRIPEIMARSGALLKEVGTTNRTHPGDYEGAINERTGLLLKVHTSNYKIVGFVAEVGLAPLVAIGKRHRIPVMEDLGSGALVDLTPYGVAKEPVVAERIALGADIVTFSGDKVLGGPQAGLIAGSAPLVRQISRNPLHRALRCGKLTISALEATLRLYRESPDITQDIPALKAFTRPLQEIEMTARRALPALERALGPEFRLSLEDATSQMGSGALPTQEIPTKVIVVEHAHLGAGRIAERFRDARPPIIGRIYDERFLLDVRTIFDPDDLVPRYSSAPSA